MIHENTKKKGNLNLCITITIVLTLHYSSCQLCHDLFTETLAVAGSGPSLDLLMDKIQGNQLSENRTASIFFSLANNIQSPEAVEKILVRNTEINISRKLSYCSKIFVKLL